MVLMLLDHTRDFSLTGRFDPETLTNSSPLFFLTRWVTHFCAPIFVFLAGTGAFLSLSRGQSKGSLRFFLLSRGLWLIFLEFTVVKIGWFFSFDYHFFLMQVIYAIGLSMIFLACVIDLPPIVVAMLGSSIIALHNLGDPITVAKSGSSFIWWDFLHTGQRSFQPSKGYFFHNVYPVLPWFGIMALGYGLGGIFQLPTAKRRTALLLWFLGLLSLFLCFRYLNGYGDSKIWKHFPTDWQTIASFCNPQKYPPSLHYTCMTLAGMFLLLLLFDFFSTGPLQYFLLVIGRVPLFFYIVHLYLAHGLGWLANKWKLLKDPGLTFFPKFDDTYVIQIYINWAIALLILFPLCIGYDKLKRKHGGILRYL